MDTPIANGKSPSRNHRCGRHTSAIITGTATTTPEESEHFRKFIEDMKFSRKELRKMFHAVTHGGAIVFQSYFNAEYDNGETEEFVRNVYINRPRILRKMIADGRFVSNYDIVRLRPKRIKSSNRSSAGSQLFNSSLRQSRQ